MDRNIRVLAAVYECLYTPDGLKVKTTANVSLFNSYYYRDISYNMSRISSVFSLGWSTIILASDT